MAKKREPKDRYTPAELEEFKVLLDAKLEEARTDLKLLNDALDAELTKKPTAVITDARFVAPEFTVTREDCDQLRGRQEKFIAHLQDAQKRIANGTYGICRVTGKLISKERLRMVPHSTLCIEARAISTEQR